MPCKLYLHFSIFFCMFLNPYDFSVIWILIILIYYLWEISRNIPPKVVLFTVGQNNFGNKIPIPYCTGIFAKRKKNSIRSLKFRLWSKTYFSRSRERELVLHFILQCLDLDRLSESLRQEFLEWSIYFIFFAN